MVHCPLNLWTAAGTIEHAAEQDEMIQLQCGDGWPLPMVKAEEIKCEAPCGRANDLRSLPRRRVPLTFSARGPRQRGYTATPEKPAAILFGPCFTRPTETVHILLV